MFEPELKHVNKIGLRRFFPNGALPLIQMCCISKRVIVTISMMTSSYGNIFRVTGPLCGEFTGPGEFPTQRPVTRSFDVFFDLRPNKRLSKQPWGWWFETQSWSLWRQCNVDSALINTMKSDTKWLRFWWRHFQWYFLVRQCLYQS